MVSRDPAYGGERAPYKDLTVYLQGDGKDTAIRIGVEVRIESTVDIQASDVVSRDATYAVEPARY